MNRPNEPDEPDEHDAMGWDGYDDDREPGMSLLEQRYRGWLRLLPASYRADWEEDMVGTYLECTTGGAGSDELRPSLPEIASVAALAVRVRLGGVGAAPRFFAWGETVRLAGVLALFGLAVQSVLGAYFALRLHGLLGSPPDPLFDEFWPPGSLQRLWDSLLTLLGLGWLPAFVALVRGQRRGAKAFALLALAATFGGLATHLVIVAGDHGPWLSDLVHRLPGLALVLLPVLALLAGFHGEAPPVRAGGGWLTSLGASGGVLLVGAVIAGDGLFTPDDWMAHAWWLADGGLECLLLIPAGLICAGAYLIDPARRDPSWPMALAILTLPVLALRAAAAIRYSQDFGELSAEGAVLTVIARVEATAVAALGLILLALATRSLRHLPRRFFAS